MKRNLFILTCVIFWVLFFCAQSWAQCPEASNDQGVCDTLYAICYDSMKLSPSPWEIHFSFLVTNDIVDPVRDSKSP